MPAIRTACWRRAGFASLGVVAVLLRLVTFPWRRRAVARRDVLILEPFGMGDVVSLEPLTRQLLDRGWRVSVAGQARWRACLPADARLSWLDTELPWRGEGRSSAQAVRCLAEAGFFRTLRALRPAARGAVGLDPRGDIRSVLVLYLAGCRRVVTFSRYYVAADCRLPPGAAHRVIPPTGCPRWRVNLALLSDRSLGGESQTDPVEPPSVAHLAAGSLRVEPGCLVLVPMTPWTGKSWPAEHWQALLPELRRVGWQPVGCCGPDEAAAALALLGPETPLQICGDIRAWVSQLQQAQAVVCVNTGAMHLADALGKRLVLLNGSSQYPLWGPTNANALVLHPDPARHAGHPCHEVPDNLAYAAAAMAAIRPTAVLDALGLPD